LKVTNYLQKHKKTISLILLFLVGFFLRVWDLGKLSLWRDESFSVNAAMNSYSEILSITINDTQPPLHLFFTHAWGEIFNYSEFSVRFLSVLFSMLALYFLYRLASLYFEDRFVTAAVALGVANPLLIEFAREARPYSMFIAFFTAALFFSSTAMRERFEKSSTLFFFGIFSLLSLYTQNLSVISTFVFFLVHLLFFFQNAKTRRAFMNLLRTYIFISVGYFPWLITLINQYSKIQNEGFWLEFEPLRNIIDITGAFFVGGVINKQSEIAVILSILTVLFSAFLFFRTILRTRYFIKVPELTFSSYPILIFLLNMLIVFLVSFITPFYYYRYLAYLGVLVVFLMGFRIQGKFAIWVASIIFVLNISILFAGFYNHDYKADYKSSTEYIKKNYDDDSIVISTSALSFHSTEYYLDDKNYIYNPERDLRFYEGLAVINEDDYYDGNFYEYENVFIISLSFERDIESILKDAGFELLEEKSFTDLSVERWGKL